MAEPTAESADGDVVDGGYLRLDDLIFIGLAILPGAVIGGRVGYVLAHLDFYKANSLAAVDPARGSLELTLGIVGGGLTGAIAAVLLGESIGRWLHVAALPLLAAITLGKIAQALGGEGQGSPTDLPWATNYVGDGPWGSLAPAIPSHPSQLYEAGATFVVLVLMTWLIAAGVFERRDGRAFLVALALWLAARAGIATTWRDPAIAGSLSAEQILCLALCAMCLLLVPVLAAAGRREPRRVTEAAWPDPEARAHF